MFKSVRKFASVVATAAKKHTAKVAVAAAGALGLSAVSGTAHALPILDLSIASTAITTELTPALAAAMPIAGTIIAVGVGYKMFKHFVR